MANVSVVMTDGTLRKFSKVKINLLDLPESAHKWMGLVPAKGDTVFLNFSACSLREIVPEKIQIRKSDGVVLDNGYRTTGNFVSVNIKKEDFP